MNVKRLIAELLVALSVSACLALPSFAAVEPGAEAPDFELQSSDGKSVKLSDLKGKVVVLEWFNPECPFVERHYEENTFEKMAEKYGEKVQWLAIDSSAHHDAASASEWKKKESLSYPVLVDASGDVGKLYGAKTTPHLFVIDSAGKLAYAGAIDDDKAGDKPDSRVNYVEKALDEVLAGKPVSVSTTQPYGCSVKYAS